ncbi:hypothetical protein R1A27_31530 (plasmid) [Methylobacterium sp. NMS12]|uniref:hypothetical protein n=1 Tax=Methylobacterium sp. NMS12 TaxID=3079766 RepID=UPI003F885628
MNARHVYVVRGTRSNGTVIYHCPTADWALTKLRDFTAKGYSDITVLDPTGRRVSETDLIGTVEGSGAVPTEEALPGSPQISRQPTFA